MFEEDVVRQIRAGHTAAERASHQTECGGRIAVLAENEDSDIDTVATMKRQTRAIEEQTLPQGEDDCASHGRQPHH